MLKKTIISLFIIVSIAISNALPTGPISGQATYYNDAGYGACGTQINANSQMLVAIPYGLWTSANPNNDPLCSKTIKVTYNGKSITLPVKDKCPSCPSNVIDISAPAFIQLAGSLDAGRINVVWEFVNSGSGTTGSSTSGGSCSKKATVDAGQGCWDVWTSKCGNSWGESQFYAANPGVVCTALQIGQSLCCN